MEQSFYQLALNKNKLVVFNLGWHVLKNRKYEERRMSLKERAVSEMKFLSEGIWAALPRDKVGIDALRPRLSTVLTDHILTQLPSLVVEAQKALAESQQHLKRLGESRQTVSDQRRYLFQASERFTFLVNSAILATYDDPYFGDAMTDKGYEKRLRAVVQNHLIEFSDRLHKYGHSRRIVDDSSSEEEDDVANNVAQHRIDRETFVDEVRQRIRRSRGRELPGTFNPLIIGDLFYKHAEPWSRITTQTIEVLLDDLRNAVLPILRETVDEKSAERLQQHLINSKFAELETSLKTKTEELLEPQRTGHPITYNHYYVECVQKAREQHRQKQLKQKLRKFFPWRNNTTNTGDEVHKFNMEELVAALSIETETDMETFACSEAIDCMLAYYQVARKKFVDDFSNLAVEKCFLQPLATLFTSQIVSVLDDKIVEDIAAEDENSRSERKRLFQKVAVLQKSLQRLICLDRHRLAFVSNVSEAVTARDHEGEVADPKLPEVNSDGSEKSTPRTPEKAQDAVNTAPQIRSGSMFGEPGWRTPIVDSNMAEQSTSRTPVMVQDIGFNAPRLFSGTAPNKPEQPFLFGAATTFGNSVSTPVRSQGKK